MLSHPRPHFGTDGVRGTFGVNLSCEYAYVLGIAVAEIFGTDIPYVIGRDTRASGKQLSDALISGLTSKGANVQDLGILPTPGVASIASQTGNYACIVTASHNPAEDNGIKVLNLGGLKLEESLEESLEAKVTELLDLNVDEEYVPTEFNLEISGMGSAMYVSTLHRNSGVDSLNDLSIVLDCANGAAHGIAPTVFKMFGAKVTSINTESDGLNINNKCGATHLDRLVAKVKEIGADVGFAFDGDADRLMVVEDKGQVRNGDDILALFALELKGKDLLANNKVVATSMSNGGFIKFLKEHKIDFVETQVGDKFVFAAMEESGAILGGEQSGHIIRKDFAPWGDGVLNALLISQILQNKKNESNLSSSKVFDLFTPMAQVHEKVSVGDKQKSTGNEQLEKAIQSQIDLLGESSRVIVRPSGTEDVVRITVEAETEDKAALSAKFLVSVVEEVCS